MTGSHASRTRFASPRLRMRPSLVNRRNNRLSPPIQALKELKDTYRKIHPDEKDCGTFHGFRGGKNNWRVDYVFTSEKWKVKGADIIRDNTEGRYPSDHYPVKARVQIP